MSAGLVASVFLLAGLAGSIFLVTQANRVDLGPFRHSSLAASALDEVTRELSYATAVRSLTPGRSVEINLPDRTGDGVAEVLRFEWSGMPGAPLRRTFNGSTTTVMPTLHDFNLYGASRTATEQALGPITNTSGEQCWHEKTGGWFEETASLSAGAGVGTDFLPRLPEGAIQWTISKVEVRCQSSGPTTGVVAARLWTADANRRPATMLAETTINESSLDSSLNWHAFSFATPPAVSPSQRTCITLQYSGGSGIAMRVRYDDLGLQTYWLLATSNGGSSWSQHVEKGLLIRVYGTYTYSMDGVVDVTKTYHTTLGLEAQAAADPGGRMSSSARFRNQLEVAP